MTACVQHPVRMHAGRALSAITAIACVAALSTLTGCGESRSSDTARSPAASARSGTTRGFVLTHFAVANRPSGPAECPNGFALTERDFYLAKLSPAERAREERANTDWIRRLSVDRHGPNQCSQPTAYENPGHITLDGPAVVDGFDLDGSPANPATFGSCPHLEFTAPDGTTGIDNQLWRVVGCIKGYQPGSVIDEYAVANIKSGSRTILIEISDLDDERNDDSVTVGIYSSHDPVPIDAAGNIAAHASYQVTPNRRYHAVLQGKLTDGVVTAGPIEELYLEYNGQFLESEYQFRNARVRLELKEDGTVEGLIGGYWDVEAFYDAHGRQATRAGVFSIGYTCPGFYHALREAADGYPDPQTGRCTAISTAFRLRGVPAFVVHQEPSEPVVTAQAADHD